MKEFDVIVVGGGITGAGTARDCALRGLSVLLIERDDIATGATGRNHGLLHSGARYAVTDRDVAHILPAKMMALLAYRLLRSGAREAREFIAGYSPQMTRQEYREYCTRMRQ